MKQLLVVAVILGASALPNTAPHSLAVAPPPIVVGPIAETTSDDRPCELSRASLVAQRGGCCQKQVGGCGCRNGQPQCCNGKPDQGCQCRADTEGDVDGLRTAF